MDIGNFDVKSGNKEYRLHARSKNSNDCSTEHLNLKDPSQLIT